MIFDFSQVFVSPPAIQFSDWVYTDLPTPQSEIHNVVVLVGETATSTSLGGTADDSE